MNNEFEMRGKLAASLKCWHRLTEEESLELLQFFMSQQSGWQTIETAPKDREILVNDTTGYANWASAHWIENSCYEGWAYTDELANDSNPLGPQPTQWFDVPPVPCE